MKCRTRCANFEKGRAEGGKATTIGRGGYVRIALSRRWDSTSETSGPAYELREKKYGGRRPDRYRVWRAMVEFHRAADGEQVLLLRDAARTGKRTGKERLGNWGRRR
jgi:hypothetical protein